MVGSERTPTTNERTGCRVSEETPETPQSSAGSPAEPAEGAPLDPASAGDPARSRRSRILRGALAAFVVLVLLVSGGVAYAYFQLAGNIHTIGGTDKAGASTVVRPTASSASPTKGAPKVHHKPVNILILGNDTRKGDNSFIGGAGEGGSDTAILLHLSADRKWAAGVSIPRDSMVQIPDCKKSSGGIEPGHLGMFNSAYAIGGPLCTRDTVEQLTHVRIDHFLVVDFEGFRSMVSALGGVNVCLPQPIQDVKTHLDLAAGPQKLNGLEALGYVRVRHIGTGSDLDRIKRQQTFISALIQQVTSSKMLFHPTTLYSFLNAATNSLTTDSGLGSPRKLASLGNQVRSIGLDNIQFVTVPTEAYPPDHNRLQWTTQAPVLWNLIANDTPLPGTAAAKPKPSPSPSVSSSPTGSPLVAAPGTIHVKVLNGAGKPGVAAAAAAELTALGYDVVGTGDAPRVTSTVIRWSQPRDESARTLAAATGATSEETTGLGQVIDLVIGPDYASAHAVTVKPTSSSSTASPSGSGFGGRNASQDICS